MEIESVARKSASEGQEAERVIYLETWPPVGKTRETGSPTSCQRLANDDRGDESARTVRLWTSGHERTT